MAPNPNPDFESFRSEAMALGFNEVLERRWDPGMVVEGHTHPFDVMAIVVGGEMWLDCGESVLHLQPGGRFELDAGAVHSERYGPEGAVYWVARRHPAGSAA